MIAAAIAPAPAPAQQPGAEGGLPPEVWDQIEQSVREDRGEAEAGAAQQGAAARAPAPAAPAAAAPARRGNQGMNPDLTLILDAAAAWLSRETGGIGGGHDPHAGFTLQQVELAAFANVDPFFRLDAQIVLGETEVEVEEAYATTLALPWRLQARAGRFSHRFGRHNATHLHAWSFTDLPIVIAKLFGPDGGRGNGAELSWLAPLPWYLEVGASSSGPEGGCCARTFADPDDLAVRDPGDLVHTGFLKQFHDLGRDWGLLWGLSAQLGPGATAPDDRAEIYGGDLYLRWRPAASRAALSLQAEALHRRRRGSVRLADSGGYAQVVWRIAQRWETGARHEEVGGAPGDPLDPALAGTRRRSSAQVSFYPSEFSRLRLQGGHDRPPWADPVWSVVLALEVLAGAHGAHTY